MTLCVRYVLFVFLIITTPEEGKSQWGLDTTFLQQAVVNFFFPKDMGIERVRKMNQAGEMGGIVVLDFIGMIEQYGYPAEEHKVTTEDGYNIRIHRIPGSPLLRNKAKKNVVFLQHGMLVSSEYWVMFGPNRDLAFLLADQGYDVWLGNIRGNSYGRSHINMTIYDRNFWQFSFHEPATMDLPVMFDYILNHTEQKAMHYVGHSMGTTLLLVLLSLKPEYNAKIKLAFCFAPAVFLKNTGPIFKQIAYTMPVLSEFLASYNVYDMGSQSAGFITLARTFCHDRAITQFICVALISLVAGADLPQLNTTALPYLLSHVPAGISVKIFYHYYQNIFMEKFQSFDYGPVGNYEIYKQKTPISYDLSKAIAPMALFYSSNDLLVSKTDVLELAEHLPNVVLKEEVQYELFNHADFIWAIDAKTLLYDRVMEIMQKFNTK